MKFKKLFFVFVLFSFDLAASSVPDYSKLSSNKLKDEMIKVFGNCARIVPGVKNASNKQAFFSFCNVSEGSKERIIRDSEFKHYSKIPLLFQAMINRREVKSSQKLYELAFQEYLEWTYLVRGHGKTGAKLKRQARVRKLKPSKPKKRSPVVDAKTVAKYYVKNGELGGLAS